MQAAAAATSPATSNLRWHSLFPITPPSVILLPSKLSRSPSSFVPSLRLTYKAKDKSRSWNGPLKSTATDDPSLGSPERWLLEPVGDGSSKQIGFKVPLPGALEIVSDVVTVGRAPEKASLVVPVATVSGLHAQLEKKEGSLFITDLKSTNGTFIDERRLPPGAAVEVLPGSCITFGDANLAIFRVSKLKDGPPNKMDESGEAEAVVDPSISLEPEGTV